MPSPIEPVSLTYGGTDLVRADLSVVFRITRGLYEPPAVRGKDRIVPSLAGRIARNRVNDVLDIQLFGFVQAAGADTAAQQAAFVTLWRELYTLFDPKVTRALVASFPGGASQSIQARTESIVWPEDPDFAQRVGVSVAMEAIAPAWTFTPAP